MNFNLKACFLQPAHIDQMLDLLFSTDLFQMKLLFVFEKRNKGIYKHLEISKLNLENTNRYLTEIEKKAPIPY